MGLRDILTKPINFGSTVIRWTEPLLYRLRLRGDLWLRALVVLGAWAGASGIVLALFAINVDPPGIATAFGLGLILGGLPAVMLTMMLRDHSGGNVFVRQKEIHRNRWYASLSIFFFSWMEYGDWPYSVIRKCVIVPGHRIGKSFSVMLLSIGPETLVVGIPRSVDLKKLAGFLSGKGVTVTPGQSLPASLRRPMNLGLGLSIPAVAMLVFLAGGTFYLMRVGLPAGNDEKLAARRQQMPDIHDFTPPPTISELPVGTPLAGQDDATANAPPSGFEVPAPSTPESGFGFGGPRAPSSNAPVSTDSGRRTRAVGGAGGIPFERSDASGRPVIGLRSRMDEWDGSPHVAVLEPLFESASPAGDESEQVARNGYALGALDVSGTEFVDAVRPVFMRKTADGLDADDSYDGEWIGTPAERSVTRLAGDGETVIGFYGRGAAVLDAIGLVLED